MHKRNEQERGTRERKIKEYYEGGGISVREVGKSGLGGTTKKEEMFWKSKE